MTVSTAEGPGRKPVSQPEFIALMAMTIATVALSIDAMLPALPTIADSLSPEAPNRAQLVVTSFVLGMGLGTFVTGPLSDAYGRKPVVIFGALLYCFGALLAYIAPSLELLLAARLVQGLGAAAPRVVVMALVRDLYGGRDMARIMSFIMIVFTLVPAIAPSLGTLVIALAGWREIFLVFVLFSLVATVWLALRQLETLAPENRRPLRVASLRSAVAEVFSESATRLSIAVQTLAFGMLFSAISTIQPLFDQTYGRGDSFPLWFLGIALVAASGSMVNARLVGRIGMRGMVKGILTLQIGFSAVLLALNLVGLPAPWDFVVFLLWICSIFFQLGLTIGNLNALAMEPLGHIAGLAASVIAAVATVGAVIIAVPIGLAFNNTPIPLAIGVLICAALGVWLTAMIKRPGES